MMEVVQNIHQQQHLDPVSSFNFLASYINMPGWFYCSSVCFCVRILLLSNLLDLP